MFKNHLLTRTHWLEKEVVCPLPFFRTVHFPSGSRPIANEAHDRTRCGEACRAISIGDTIKSRRGADYLRAAWTAEPG